jgi:hypothetical protein
MGQQEKEVLTGFKENSSRVFRDNTSNGYGGAEQVDMMIVGAICLMERRRVLP